MKTQQIYICLYCGKGLTSFTCGCEGSKNSNLWSARGRQSARKKLMKLNKENEK